MTDDVELTPVEQRGYVLAHIKDDGGAYRFDLADAGPLLTAWTNGAAFFTGRSVFGGQQTVKLALVEGVAVWDAEACAACERNNYAERERERHRKLVEGEA